MATDRDVDPTIDEDAAETTNPQDPWSPIQFDLKWILFITGCCAIVLGSVRVVGVAGIFHVILALLGGWLVIGCLRVIRLSRRR